MKKETLVAAIAGISLGVIIAIFILISYKQKEIKSKKTITPQITPTISILNVKSQNLEINSPLNEEIINKNTITIKGKADTGSLLIFQSPTTEKTTKNIQEDFSIEFPLSMGENVIKVTSYKDKNIEEKSLKVYYLEE